MSKSDISNPVSSKRLYTIKNMVANKINRSDFLGFYIFHNLIERMPYDTFVAVVFLFINHTDIWCQIFSFVKVIFNYTNTAFDFVAT